jgi:hypothetical protein
MDVPTFNSSLKDAPNISDSQKATASLQNAENSSKARGQYDRKSIEKIRLEKQRKREEQRLLQQRLEEERKKEIILEPILRPMVDVERGVIDIKGEKVKIMTYNVSENKTYKNGLSLKPLL